MEFYDARESENDSITAAAVGEEVISDVAESITELSIDATAAVSNAAEQIIEKNFDLAQQAKECGNEYFRQKDYDRAIDEYSRAIEACPETDEHSEFLSILLGNRAACHFAEDEFDMAVEDCTKSIALNPSYIKVLLRRSSCNEKLDKLEDAIQDLKSVQSLDPKTPKISDNIKRLEKLHEEKMNKLKDEALGKLKDLGNTILGNFGLSLDNFKMAQDPATGSWSINMNNGK